MGDAEKLLTCLQDYSWNIHNDAIHLIPPVWHCWMLGKLLLRLFGAENQLQAVRFSAPKWSLNLTTRRITPCEGFPRTGCCAQALSFYLHIQPKTNTWNISRIHLLSTHVWKSGKDWTCMNMSCIHIPHTYKSKRAQQSLRWLQVQHHLCLSFLWCDS